MTCLEGTRGISIWGRVSSKQAMGWDWNRDCCHWLLQKKDQNVVEKPRGWGVRIHTMFAEYQWLIGVPGRGDVSSTSETQEQPRERAQKSSEHKGTYCLTWHC